MALAADVTLGGIYDIQHGTGESYKASGQDRFVINALYLKVKAGLSENVESIFIIDGAVLAKETTDASHKYIQNYDKTLFDPLMCSLEIDRVWGLNAGYEICDSAKLEAGVWEQNCTGDVSIYENYTARLVLTPMGAFHTSLDYKIGEKTSLMLEYQNKIGEGSVKDISDISAGVIAKF